MQRLFAAACLGLMIAGAAAAQEMPLQVDGPTEMERNGVRAWSRENIVEAPYAYFGFASDHTIYWMAAEGPGKRVLIREEYFESQTGAANPWRASKALVDLDCAGGKWRKLSVDLYPNNSLRGEAMHSATPDAAWNAPAEGSDDAFLLSTICK